MYDKLASDLLVGAIDTHIHTFPSHDPNGRSVDDFEAVVQARKAGMKAIVIKDHFGMTANRALLAQKLKKYPIFGGVALNTPVGGLNPHAVRAALHYGAKEIWMPTSDAANYLNGPRIGSIESVSVGKDEGIELFNPQGELRKEAILILEMIAKADVILGTGHISVLEAMKLVDAAIACGVKKILITHPHVDFLNYSINDMKQLVMKGAILEHVFVNCTSSEHYRGKYVPPSRIAKDIKTIGPENCIIATDGGQPVNPTPVEMLKEFIVELLRNGLSRGDISVMVKENPSRLLGL